METSLKFKVRPRKSIRNYPRRHLQVIPINCKANKEDDSEIDRKAIVGVSVDLDHVSSNRMSTLMSMSRFIHCPHAFTDVYLAHLLYRPSIIGSRFRNLQGRSFQWLAYYIGFYASGVVLDGS